MKEFTSDVPSGTPNPLAGVSFALDGVTFRCEGRTSLFELSDLARRIGESPGDVTEEQAAADPGLAAAAAAAQAAMSETLLQALGDAEYQRFRRHCHARHTPDEVIVQVMRYINEAVRSAVQEDTGRPTAPPSPSPDGPSDPAGRTSRVISLQAGDVTVISPDGTRQPVMRAGRPVARQPAKTTVKRPGGKDGTGRKATA